MPRRPDPINLTTLTLSVVRGPRDDGRYYWRARTAGGGSTLWTGWATREEAARQGAQLLVTPPAPAPEPRLGTIADLLEVWLDFQGTNPNLRDSTRQLYAKYARHLRRVLGKLPVEDLKLATMEGYRDLRLKEGAAPRTVSQELVGLRAAWNHASRSGQVPPRLLPEVRVKVRGYVLNHRTPTEAEVAALLPYLRPEHALALHLLTATGARIGEIVYLRRKAIDLPTRLIHLDGKTGPRTFPLTEDLEALLQGRLDGTDRPLLDLPRHADQAIRAAIARACARAGVPPFTPHGLRRLAVVRMAQAGVDVATAATITGHRPEVMLGTYRTVRPEELLEAMLRAGLDSVLEGAA